MVHTPSTPPVSDPAATIVPNVEVKDVPSVKEYCGDRQVIVSTPATAAAHTPTNVSLMNDAKCAAMVETVSAGNTLFPMAVPPIVTNAVSPAAHVPAKVTVAEGNEP